KAIPIVIIEALIGGWIVAMFITPTYLNIFIGEHKKVNKGSDMTLPQKLFEMVFGILIDKKQKKKQKKIQEEDKNYEEGLFANVQKKYKSLVKSALKYRYVVVFVLIILLIGSISLVPKLGFKFLP